MISPREIEFLCDAYQRIADQRRIAWVNERDDKHDANLVAFTVFTLILFLAALFL